LSVSTHKALDVAAIRKDFPILETGIAYLDSANTSQRPRQVTGAMLDYFEQFNSNIHRAAYHIAEEATLRYEATREKVRDVKWMLRAMEQFEEDLTILYPGLKHAFWLRGHLLHEPGLGVTVRELNGLPDDLAESIGRMHHDTIVVRLVRLLKSGVESGAFRPIDARASAVAILGIMLLFLRLQPREYGQFTRAQMIDQVLDYYAAGLRPEVAATPFRAEPIGQSTSRPSALTGRRN